jgi:hypothetical protein
MQCYAEVVMRQRSVAEVLMANKSQSNEPANDDTSAAAISTFICVRLQLVSAHDRGVNTWRLRALEQSTAASSARCQQNSAKHPNLAPHTGWSVDSCGL